MKHVLVLCSVFIMSSILATRVENHASRSSSLRRSDFISGGPVGTISIVIDKSDYELSIYDEKGWFATYPVVFGNNSLGDKRMQGDKNTPEGSFKIVNKRVHDKWCRYMGLDYPTKESYDRFQARKQRGEIPANASIGGGIGIHGTWPHEDFVIDRYTNWTEGCISMKNTDVSEVYSYVKPGETKVTVKR